MADPGHLEKMGRELKCPICLSLLKSAASLGCNHVFCNSCIMESMKSVSDCPVCKVPFRRREVRPAPHMDNLVTVFKSMEVAAGFNIFTTQVAPSTKCSGDADNSGIPETAIAHQGRSTRKGSCNNSRQKNEKANNKISNQCPARPSFPAKKRVHVTPYPVTETPLRPEKVSKSGNTDIELESNKDADENKKGYEDRQQDSLFSPFFWLREENDDDSSEKPSAQTTANSPQPYNAPCFSDIKDSDDDRSPIKMTSTSKASVAEHFDSEIFEWTQRACSPELCSTPLSKKTAGKYKPIHERDCLEVPETGIYLSNEVSKMENTKTVQADGSGPTKRTICAKKRTLKRRKSLNGHSQIKDSCKENEDPKQMEFPSKLNGNTKNDNNNDDVEAQASKEAFTIESKTEKNKDTGAVLPLSTRSKTNSDIATDVQSNTRKRGKKLTFHPKKKHMKTSLIDIKSKVLEEVPDNNLNEANTGNQECHKAITSPQVLPCEQTEYGQGCGSNADKHGEELPQKVVESRKKGRRNHPSDIVLKNDINKVSLASSADRYENNQTSIDHPDSKILGSKGFPQTKAFIPQNRDTILRKCGNLQSQLICAFCQSSYDTEDSGEMMHYFNGKPVDADYNGGIKVIHSHKHCTEWAPDVYFEDDLAVNLATELARSRRIKCSCCGIKGAALGCYDKSCRKSFHFPCAKLVPECRWDNENFVMLCPFHSSTEFPKELSRSEKQRKKRSRAREEPQAPSPSVFKTCQAMGQMWAWPSGSPCKWVLCCSALTTMEKEIISEFTKLTNVSISKTWSSAVTHVIASTDANGACKRTLKFLMGILDGKWILSIEWVKACMMAMGPVDEEKFEITVDVHGISGGPRLGRMRAINKEPKLFSNLRFYLSGGFMPAYRGYLQDLITSAGGTILQRKPLTRDQEKLIDSSTTLVTLIIYSLEVPEKREASNVVFECRLAEAQALADACGAKVAANSWIIESIAASKLQPLTC